MKRNKGKGMPSLPGELAAAMYQTGLPTRTDTAEAVSLGTESPFALCAACGDPVLVRVWRSSVGTVPGHWHCLESPGSPVCGVPHTHEEEKKACYCA